MRSHSVKNAGTLAHNRNSLFSMSALMTMVMLIGSRYWDWTLDTASNATFLASPVLSSSAFGGNGPYVDNGTVVGLEGVPGRTGGGCVPNGAFKDMEIHLGPGKNMERNNQCLTRDIAFPVILKCLTATAVDKALAAESYQAFDIETEGGITPETFTYHAGGHLGIGGAYGTIADLYASPGGEFYFFSSHPS